MRATRAEKTFALFGSPANKKIISQLESGGANLVLFPEVETEEIDLSSGAEKFLKDLSRFDWVIFTNVFSVDHFLRALEKLEIDFFELDALRLCAFGETVADRLRFVQVHSDVISNGVDSREVFQALRDYESSLEKSRFLIPREELLAPAIANLLSKTGAAVTEVPLYRAKSNDTSSLPKLRALLRGGAIDEFVFCSPSEPGALAALFSSEDLSELPAEVLVSATNPAALQALREFGITRAGMRQP